MGLRDGVTRLLGQIECLSMSGLGFAELALPAVNLANALQYSHGAGSITRRHEVLGCLGKALHRFFQAVLILSKQSEIAELVAQTDGIVCGSERSHRSGDVRLGLLVVTSLQRDGGQTTEAEANSTAVVDRLGFLLGRSVDLDRFLQGASLLKELGQIDPRHGLALGRPELSILPEKLPKHCLGLSRVTLSTARHGRPEGPVEALKLSLVGRIAHRREYTP